MQKITIHENNSLAFENENLVFCIGKKPWEVYKHRYQPKFVGPIKPITEKEMIADCGLTEDDLSEPIFIYKCNTKEILESRTTMLWKYGYWVTRKCRSVEFPA